MRARYLLPAFALVVVACNGDSEATPSPEPVVTDPPVVATDPPATDPPVVATDAPAASDAPVGATDDPAGASQAPVAVLPAECVMPPYDIAIDLTGSGESETFTVVDAEDGGAGERSEGTFAYTMYVTDFEIADTRNVIDQVLFPPEGTTVFTLEIRRVADPDDPTPSREYPIIGAGEELMLLSEALGPEQLAARLTVAGPDLEPLEEPDPETVTGTVLYSQDGTVCLDLAITSKQGYSIEGIITAHVRPNLMLGT